MTCKDCPYHWADPGERYPTCKYPYNDCNAPCEIDEDYETEDIDNECFDLLEELMEQNADVLKRLKEM